MAVTEHQLLNSFQQAGWFSQYTQLAHYFSLLCFLLTIITLLLTFCLLQITLVFQSQSKLRETKVRDLTNRLEKLNQSYRFLFSQYPALNQYCPVSNSTTGGFGSVSLIKQTDGSCVVDSHRETTTGGPDFHRCNKALSAKDQDTAPCQWYQRVYKSLCPMSWVQKWDDQLEAGTFPGKI
eukprot:superscaffoldBa00001770_g11945